MWDYVAAVLNTCPKPQWITSDIEGCIGFVLFFVLPASAVGSWIYHHCGGPGLVFTFCALAALLGLSVEPASVYTGIYGGLAILYWPLVGVASRIYSWI